MKFDLHTHHERCGHAYGTIEEYIVKAIEMGIEVIGITDHCPNFSSQLDHPTPRLKMAKSEFSAYVREILHLKQKYASHIEVLLGVESDYIPEYVDLYKHEYEKYPFDYILGSIHGIDDVSIFAKQEWEKLDETGLEKLKIRYLQLLQGAASSKAYQVIGHFDALKTHIPDYDSFASVEVDETLKRFGEWGTVIEVNTSGERKGLLEWFPSKTLLERAHFYGVQVTYGSDAHRKEHLGTDWDQVRQVLKQIGYKEWVIFRKKQLVKLAI